MYVSDFWFTDHLLLDPQLQNPVLHVVIEDLLQCVAELWDKLPIDTVIASILDPRTKWYDKIPSGEVTEGLKILKQVIYCLFL